MNKQQDLSPQAKVKIVGWIGKRPEKKIIIDNKEYWQLLVTLEPTLLIDNNSYNNIQKPVPQNQEKESNIKVKNLSTQDSYVVHLLSFKMSDQIIPCVDGRMALIKGELIILDSGVLIPTASNPVPTTSNPL